MKVYIQKYLKVSLSYTFIYQSITKKINQIKKIYYYFLKNNNNNLYYNTHLHSQKSKYNRYEKLNKVLIKLSLTHK